VDKERKHSVTTMPFLLVIALGSEGIQTFMKYLKVAERYGVGLVQGMHLWAVLIDDHFTPPRDMESNPLKNYDAQALHVSFIPATLVDKESRLHLRDKGRLWMLDEHSILEPGVRAEKVGTGNQPVWGRAQVRMNEPAVTRAVDQGLHAFSDQLRQLEEARQGGGPVPDSVLRSLVFYSPVGGFGAGALHEMLRLLKNRAALAHVPLKTYLRMLDLGTLYPANREVAVVNRNRAMNFLRILSTGAYRDLEGLDGAQDGPLFDSLLVCPNAGPHGEIGTLTGQEWLSGQQTFLEFNSPLSARLREDAVDVESKRDLDETGAVCAGNAMGVSVISLDRDAYRRYCAKATVARFNRAILECPASDAVTQGEQAAAESGLIESYAESLTVRRITQAAGSDPDMFQESLGAYSDRVGDLSGLAALRAIDAGYSAVVSEVIPRVLQPRVQQRSRTIVEDVGKRCAKEKAAYANDLFGPRRLRGWDEGLLNSVESSMRVNDEKRNALTQHGESIFQGIDDCRTRLQAFSRMGWFNRMLHFFSIRSTARRYDGLARRGVRLECEQMVRTMVQEEVFLPARQTLRGELAERTLVEGKLEALAEASDRDALATLTAKPSLDRVPLGVELADDVSLRRFLTRAIEAKGGAVKVTDHLCAMVTQKEKSLFALLDRPSEEFAQRLLTSAGELYEAEIRSLSLQTVFQERYKEAVIGLIAKGVQDSRPWVRTSGEATRHIPMVKLVGLPPGCDEKWFMDQLKKADHSEGEWEAVKLPGGYYDDVVLFLTYRANVSLTMLINQQVPGSGKENIASRVRTAADPMAARIPQGELTSTDTGVVTLYAVLCGLLRRDAERGWLFQAGNDNAVEVGNTPSAVRSFFRKSFTEVVSVYSALGAALRANAEGVEAQLRTFEKTWFQDDALLSLLSDETVKRALVEVRLLSPFVRAMVAQETRE